MCEFISYIEKHDIETNAVRYLYLTDEDVFSSRGRELFRDSKDNDCLGHGAIRLYFGCDGKPLQGGKDCEVKDFWNANKLPKELADKIKEFDKHWGRMFRQFFQKNDLYHIINRAPEEWKARAWEQLLKQKPMNSDLRYIINCAPEEWKAKAWEQLLKQQPINDDLRYIIYYAPEEWKAKAWEQLLRQKPTKNDLYNIIYYAPEEWRAKARALLG